MQYGDGRVIASTSLRDFLPEVLEAYRPAINRVACFSRHSHGLAFAVVTLDEADGAIASTGGAEVADHLLHFARSEQEVYDKAVTDYERARYFERI